MKIVPMRGWIKFIPTEGQTHNNVYIGYGYDPGDTKLHVAISRDFFQCQVLAGQEYFVPLTAICGVVDDMVIVPDKTIVLASH